MNTIQEEQKFTFRPSWNGSIEVMDERNRNVARQALLEFCLGKEVDLTSLPEGARVLLNEANYCLQFDRDMRARKQEAYDRHVKGKPRSKEKKSPRAVHKVNEVSEANEVNEVNNMSETNEERLTPSSLSSQQEEQELGRERAKDLRGMIQEVHEYWNLAIKREGARLPRVKTAHINGERKEKIARRLQEYGMEAFKKAVDNAASSQFLNVEAGNAPVNFDWFVSASNFTKVLEGNYARDYRKKHLKVDDDMPTKEDIENDKGLVDYDD